MTRIFNFSPLTSFAKDESGATAIEYGLFAALIAAVIVGSVVNLGNETNSSFETVSSAMATATADSGSGGSDTSGGSAGSDTSGGL